MEKLQQKKLIVNGIEQYVLSSPSTTLATVLREHLELTGTKVGCGEGQCGACSVMLNGKVVRSCVTKMKRVPEGACIITIEGIGQPDNLDPLQQAWVKHGAAQCGFCSPGFIVSAKGLLNENDNPTREEVRDWFRKHKNACRCTGYKPLVDAVMEAAKVVRGEAPAESLDFVMPEDGRIWGSSYPRPTAVAKATGTLDYGADLGLKMPAGTLRLALVQAEVSHAKINGIDTSEAENMPGVHCILTAKDVKGKNRIFGLACSPRHKGDGWERPILCDEKVFQYGDAVAIVCADTEAEARAAAAKVRLDLEQLPAYMSAAAAMADDALEIHPGTPNIYFEQPLIKGDDPAPIFDQDDVAVVSGEYRSSRQPHMPIEPDVGFAYMGDDDLLHIHSKSIAVHLHAMMIAEGLGLKPEQIALAANPMGGTFGYKLSPTMEALLGVAVLATGRPVSLCYDYYQQMTYTGKRSPFHVNARMAADKKTGRIVALEHDYVVDHGPYCEMADVLTGRGIQFIGAGYDIPSIRGMGRTVATNHAWGAAFRGFGGPQAHFAGESLVDELALALDMDPLEFRYANCYRPGSTTPTGQEPDVYPLPEMLDALRPKYEEAKKRAEAGSTPTHAKGVGIALGVYGSGGDGVEQAEVFVQYDEDDGVTVGASWEDHGQGADIGAVGTAHETLLAMGVPPEKIRFSWPDSAKQPPAGPAGASRSQVVVGGAIRVACEALMGAARKDDGTYMTCAEMVAADKPLRYDGSYSIPGVPCDPDTGLGNPFLVYMYVVHLAEITVEKATGKVSVDRMSCIADIGKINNKLATDGQIWGCMAQGIGLALTEDFEDIKKHSTMIGAGFPYISAIPDDLEITYIQTPRQWGPFGAAGVGEGPIASPHVAITNAIRNACGARVTSLPALPEKVLAGMPHEH
ncbi:molybdopterin-dependent oxidoreductase [Pseudodesulfovibrio cashew]|uniref:Molybdopterin-dependent oxidoreductase n=1 Tax=Pseudodesulfovibrio cashew TaxID=2678688 RepID=A0A6I6JGJ3_9BACT|nr:molybdopterin-dependent aldehyde oxidoreductase [Pseudodesulfovibrio cashew]QGY40279.1 molybdopterin-dependent oxidoreductase [Pseudodesulfovibrio cashew]